MCDQHASETQQPLHPAEPWTAHLATVVAVREKPAPNIVVAIVPSAQMNSFEQRQQTARRIAACITACAGIPTATLEDVNSSERELLHHYVAVLKQRDALLHAAENVVQCFGGDVPDWLQSNIDALAEAVNAADDKTSRSCRPAERV